MSHSHASPALLLAGLTFALGLGIGATLRPITGGRVEAMPASTVPAQSSPSVAVRMAHPAEVLRVIDGDTFEAKVNLWPGLDITTRVRLRGIDAPEMKARCGEERVKAEAARDALRSILDQGEVGISRVTLDKYGAGCRRGTAQCRIGAALQRRAPRELVPLSTTHRAQGDPRSALKLFCNKPSE